ncbi:hypothetical protein F183_A04920 [Bryobacterales bacterium F-183]|nr:hypothetical protein F183_A04920 [Bryobacterales bacterium F-183]
MLKTNQTKLAAAVFFAAAAFSFADCPDGARNTTPAEQQFEVATLEALAAAVPAPPPGWEVNKPQLYKTGRTSVCKGTDASHIVYSLTYDWVEGRKEMIARTNAMQKKMAELRRMPPEMEAEYGEVGKQARALRRDAAKARALKNVEEVARLEAEAKVLEAKAAKIKEAHTNAFTPKVIEAMKEFQAGEDGRSYSVSLLLAANEAPAYAKSASGAAAPTPEGAEMFTGVAKPAPAKLKVQNVVVRWTGKKEHMPMFTPLVDRAALAKIMQ